MHSFINKRRVPKFEVETTKEGRGRELEITVVDDHVVNELGGMWLSPNMNHDGVYNYTISLPKGTKLDQVQIIVIREVSTYLEDRLTVTASSGKRKSEEDCEEAEEPKTYQGGRGRGRARGRKRQ
jgi:hypothetical protein